MLRPGRLLWPHYWEGNSNPVLTSTTVGDARSQLGWLIPDPDEFLQNLNQGVSSVINNGLWEGVIRKVIFNGSSTGYISLPPFFSSIIGATLRGIPRMIFNQYHQYIESGPGIIDMTDPSYGPLEMMGDEFVTVTDHINGQNIDLLTTTVTDAGKVVRIFFENADGSTFFDSTGSEGLNMTLVLGAVISPVPVYNLKGVQKPVTVGNLTIESRDAFGTITPLSTYYPWETRPHYTRYQTGTVDPDQPIQCLCRIGYRPLVADTDWVVPGDLNALEFALQAIDCQHTRNYSEAAQAWKQCYDQLNQEVRALRGKAQPSVTLIGPSRNNNCWYNN